MGCENSAQPPVVSCGNAVQSLKVEPLCLFLVQHLDLGGASDTRKG